MAGLLRPKRSSINISMHVFLTDDAKEAVVRFLKIILTNAKLRALHR